MLISVLIHNINRGSILGPCLESVAAQTHRPLEVVVLDAGSTDGSPELIQEALARMEEQGIRTRFKSVPLTGVSTSRNLAAAEATGDLFCFLDNDALFQSPDSLIPAARLFRSLDRLGAITFKVLKADTEDLDYGCWVHRRPSAIWRDQAFQTFTFVGGGCLIRARAFRECGGFWDELSFSREEEDLALELIERGWRLVYLPQTAIRHHADPRGRAKAERHRSLELQNGLAIFWRRMPYPAAVAASLARIGTMSLRALVKDRLSLGPLLVPAARAGRMWRERGLSRRPVSWRAVGRYLARHRGHGLELPWAGGPKRNRERMNILGFPFDPVSFEDTVEEIQKAVVRSRRLHIITANVDHVMIARRDKGMREDWAKAGLVVADGVPVLWAARLLGRPLKDRVNGTDLVWACAELSARLGFPVALVGSAPEVAQAAQEKMEERFPGADLKVIPTPFPLTQEESLGIVAEIKRIGAEIVLVGLGAPRQQRWIETHLEASGAAVGIGIGGALDLIAGRYRRAPVWMQKHGLEWFHRMCQEPGRLGRRYLIEDLPFGGLVLLERLGRGRGGKG